MEHIVDKAYEITDIRLDEEQEAVATKIIDLIGSEYKYTIYEAQEILKFCQASLLATTLIPNADALVRAIADELEGAKNEPAEADREAETLC